MPVEVNAVGTGGRWRRRHRWRVELVDRAVAVERPAVVVEVCAVIGQVQAERVVQRAAGRVDRRRNECAGGRIGRPDRVGGAVELVIEREEAPPPLVIAPRTTLAPSSGWALSKVLPWRVKSAPRVTTRL